MPKSNDIVPIDGVDKMQKCHEQSGALSDVDIKEYIDRHELVIFPYDEEKLTGLGYNLSFTKFIYSINKKTLCEIKCEGNDLYCYAAPNDTLLIISHEAVWISKLLSGTFYSKVGMVSKGFGHISTTLDPEWEGPLLFSLNNPTNQRIKFQIGKKTEAGIKYNTFVTLMLHKMISKANKTHDNKPGRIYDILEHVKNDLKTKNDDGKTINVFDEIDFLQIKRIKIDDVKSAEEKNEKIIKFREKYQKLDEVIEDCIKDINKVKIQEKIQFWIKIGLSLLSIVSLNFFVIWKSNEALTGIFISDNQGFVSSFLSVIAILISIDVPIFTIIVKKIGGK